MHDALTAGQLIASIDAFMADNGDRRIRFGFDPDSGHSYRGHYNYLAFEPKDNVLLSSMLRALESNMGLTYTGYKGGDFLMGGDTPVYIAYKGLVGEPITKTVMWYWLDTPVDKPEPEPAISFPWADVNEAGRDAKAICYCLASIHETQQETNRLLKKLVENRNV